MTGVVGCSADAEPAEPAQPSRSATTVVADCAPDPATELAAGPQTFSFDGQERSYLLDLPDGYDRTQAHPLLLAFHGHGGSKEAASAVSQLGDKGTARGYVVVFADALGNPRAWNLSKDTQPDDYGFVNALIAELSERLCIDAERIYASGHSNGSAFTGFLACTDPYRFAAVAMVAAFIPSTCPVEEAAPAVVAIHGTADPGVPYNGGPVAGGPAQIPPAQTTLDTYRDHYGCDPAVVEDQPQPGIRRRTYSGCVWGAEVVLYSVVDGGHDWPTGPFVASDAILDFFDAHPTR